jgi:hypothetical protein
MNHNEAIEFYWTSIKARAAFMRLAAKATNAEDRASLLDEARSADCDVAFARKEMVK